MEVYKSKYLQIAFFVEHALIEITWLSETKYMYLDEYKQELLNFLDITHQLKPKRIIPDSRNLLYTIGPKLQEWTNQAIILPCLSIGINNVALVVSQDTFSQLSIQQMMTEAEDIKFTTKYFNTKEEAKKWVLSAA